MVKPGNIPFQFLPDSNSFQRFHSFIKHSANQTPPRALGKERVKMSVMIQRARRSLSMAAGECPRLIRFALHAPENVEVEFANGSRYNLPAEFLRVFSPAVDSKIRSIDGEKVIYGRRHVGIMSAEPVGNYGVRLLFDDLHKTGIYTWEYFYHLGNNKFTLMRSYVNMLRKHGLSRDPLAKK